MLKKAPFGLMCLLSGAIMLFGVPAKAQIEQYAEIQTAIPESQLIAQAGKWSDVILRLEDLPAGFTAMPATEIAQLKEELSQDDFVVENIFAFMAQEKFQLIMGITTLLQNEQQRQDFDSVLRQPQVLRTLISEGLEDTEVLAQEPLTNLNDIGDVAGGVSLKVDLEGVLARLEILAFRTNEMGAFIFVMYRDRERPVVPIVEVARTLNSRAQKVVSTSN